MDSSPIEMFSHTVAASRSVRFNCVVNCRPENRNISEFDIGT